MGRWRTVVKDVSKMTSAVRTMNLGSDHADGCLDGTLDGSVKLGQPVPLSNARAVSRNAISRDGGAGELRTASGKETRQIFMRRLWPPAI